MENPSTKNFSLWENTMISRVRLIAHVNLLACVPTHAGAIARVSGNSMEMSSFYTSVPKIMVIWYTVPGIWHVTDVIVIFHFGLFFALLLH